MTGTTRREERAEEIRAAGATAVVCDVFDAAALEAAVRAAEPEVVVNQLTSLPEEYNPKKIDYEPTNRVRTEGGGNLMKAALAAGARRYVTQSIAFLYAPEGNLVKDEEARPYDDAPAPFDQGVEGDARPRERGARQPRGSRGSSSATASSTAPAPTTTAAARSRRKSRSGGCRSSAPAPGSPPSSTSRTRPRRRSPRSTAARPGIYNVADDEPAAMREWLPVYAEAVGAKPPLQVPAWLARLVAGRLAVEFGVNLRGASNEKAKRELGWQPALRELAAGLPGSARLSAARV